MPCFTEGITRVRVRPLAVDRSAGGSLFPADAAAPAVAPGAVEVAWASTQAGRFHQVYVGGALAAVTADPEDRTLVACVPASADGPPAMVLVEVVAVDAADRWTDFGPALPGLGPDAGARVRLSWQAGPALDPALASFDVFADGRTGTVDYAAPLNESPLPASPGGVDPWGYGVGGFGQGAYGQAAARYEWTTDPLAPGRWRLAVVASDAAGNRLAPAAEVNVDVAPLARPAADFRLLDYDPLAREATLAWDPSPDV